MDWSVWRGPGPDFVPGGYVTALAAFEMVARNVFGEEWVGNEFAFEIHLLACGVPDPGLFFNDDGTRISDGIGDQHEASVILWGRGQGGVSAYHSPSYEEWKLAHERYRYAFEHAESIFKRKDAACTFLQTMLERGRFSVHARNQATGEMIALRPEVWNVEKDVALARFSRARVNLLALMYPVPADPIARRAYFARMTSWLFVSHASLKSVLEENPSAQSSTAPASLDDRLRGKLPANATPADIRDEEYAHTAASLVRNRKTLSVAIRDVAPSDPMRKADSIESAIRRTFMKMYDDKGFPL